jgi:DNA-binding beta-propeller fold protein YncE
VALAADRGGAVYVADADRDRVLVFDFAGTFLREIGGFAPRAGGFAGLSGIACGARGTLVTVERPRAPSRRSAPADTLSGRSRVQWLDAGGRVSRALWLPAWTAGSGETQVSVAVDDADRVAVAGERSGEVLLVGATGVRRIEGLAAPRALGFAPDATLLVAEAGAGRVRRFPSAIMARE